MASSGVAWLNPTIRRCGGGRTVWIRSRDDDAGGGQIGDRDGRLGRGGGAVMMGGGGSGGEAVAELAGFGQIWWRWLCEMGSGGRVAARGEYSCGGWLRAVAVFILPQQPCCRIFAALGVVFWAA